MSIRKRRDAKGKDKGAAGPADVVVNQRLPSRLFAMDCYPSKRLNCNSSLEYLLLVRDCWKEQTRWSTCLLHVLEGYSSCQYEDVHSRPNLYMG
ncbi:hypothetical protein N665_0116s0104 [Sinapis alba]|nr:hypothetical protein N665_0116s0104 [Sinapis alba]